MTGYLKLASPPGPVEQEVAMEEENLKEKEQSSRHQQGSSDQRSEGCKLQDTLVFEQPLAKMP